MARLPIGTALLRRYVLTGAIGQGGVSTVYAAIDACRGRKLAVKILAPALAGDPGAREDARREALITDRLRHPSVPRVFEYGDAPLPDGTVVPYVVLELLDGVPLTERLARGRLGWPEAVRIAATAADVLAVAHRRGVVHRDLTARNIMVTAGGIKIIDFGLATAAVHPDDGTAPQTPADTVAGDVRAARGPRSGTHGDGPYSRRARHRGDDPCLRGHRADDPCLRGHRADDPCLRGHRADDPCLRGHRADDPYLRGHRADEPYFRAVGLGARPALPSHPKTLFARPADDVYTLGVLLYEMLTGRSPYPPAVAATIVAAGRVGHLAPTPVLVIPGLPPELRDLVRACMAKRPEDRPPSADVALTLHRIHDDARSPVPSVN